MAKMTHFVSAKLSYSMLIGGYKQSGGEKALNQGPNTIHNPSLTSINPHLFDLSCLHCAYTNKKWATA